MRISLAGFKTSAAAWLVLGIYFWMSGIVQLTHTDDLSAFRPVDSSLHAAPAVRAAHPVPAAQPCVAHEWSGLAHSAASSTACPAQCASLVPVVAPPLAPALHLRCFADNPLRGPPSLRG